MGELELADDRNDAYLFCCCTRRWIPRGGRDVELKEVWVLVGLEEIPYESAATPESLSERAEVI